MSKSLGFDLSLGNISCSELMMNLLLGISLRHVNSYNRISYILDKVYKIFYESNICVVYTVVPRISYMVTLSNIV